MDSALPSVCRRWVADLGRDCPQQAYEPAPHFLGSGTGRFPDGRIAAVIAPRCLTNAKADGSLRIARFTRFYLIRLRVYSSVERHQQPQGRLLRTRARVCLLLLALGCASSAARPEADVEATLARGGGLSGLTETVHVWSIGVQAGAELRRSDSPRSRTVHLSTATLSTMLIGLDSLVESIPPVVRDTGAVQRLCGDVVTTHLTIRRGGQVRSAHEACPHGGGPLDAYWARVDSLFDVLVKAAR